MHHPPNLHPHARCAFGDGYGHIVLRHRIEIEDRHSAVLAIFHFGDVVKILQVPEEVKNGFERRRSARPSDDGILRALYAKES